MALLIERPYKENHLMLLCETLYDLKRTLSFHFGNARIFTSFRTLSASLSEDLGVQEKTLGVHGKSQQQPSWPSLQNKKYETRGSAEETQISQLESTQTRPKIYATSTQKSTQVRPRIDP